MVTTDELWGALRALRDDINAHHGGKMHGGGIHVTYRTQPRFAPVFEAMASMSGSRARLRRLLDAHGAATGLAFVVEAGGGGHGNVVTMPLAGHGAVAPVAAGGDGGAGTAPALAVAVRAAAPGPMMRGSAAGSPSAELLGALGALREDISAHHGGRLPASELHSRYHAVPRFAPVFNAMEAMGKHAPRLRRLLNTYGAATGLTFEVEAGGGGYVSVVAKPAATVATRVGAAATGGAGGDAAGAAAPVLLATSDEAVRAVAELRRAADAAIITVGGAAVRVLAVDLEGDLGADGALSLVQVAAGTAADRVVHVFDVYRNKRLLTDVRAGVGALFADTGIVKVMHDCRADSAALRGQAGIRLVRVWDTQAAHCVLSDTSRRVGLNELLRAYGCAENTHKDAVQHRPGLWKQRPLPEQLLCYAASDVRSLVDAGVAMITKAEARGRRILARCFAQSTANVGSRVARMDKDETAAAFYAFLVGDKDVRRRCHDRAVFKSEFAAWKARHGGKYRGGAGVVLYALTKSKPPCAKVVGGTSVQFACDKREVPTAKAAKAEQVRANVAALHDPARQKLLCADKGDVTVLPTGPKVEQPADVRTQAFVVHNGGTRTRRFVGVVIQQPRTRFTIAEPAPSAQNVPPGGKVRVTVACVGAERGVRRALVAFHFDSFAIARLLRRRIGPAAELDALGPTAPYRRPRRVRRRRGRPGAFVRGGRRPRGSIPPFVKRLAGFDIDPEWEVVAKLGEQDEYFGEHALSPDTYIELFQRLLWTEERHGMEVQLEKYAMEDAKLLKRGASSLLDLVVPGLAEKRPSVLRGDGVNITTERGVTTRGYVHDVERDCVRIDLGRAFLAQHTPDSRYRVDYVLNRTVLRLAHQGLGLSLRLRPALLFPPDEVPSLSPRKLRAGSAVPINAQLNDLQRVAVDSIVRGTGRTSPFLLYGPPGTGKTTTLVEAIHQLAARVPGVHILACAPTNAAADQLVRRLSGSPLLSGAAGGAGAHAGAAGGARAMLRVVAFSRALIDVEEAVRPYCNWNETAGGFENPTPADVHGARVVVATLSMAAKLYNLGVREGHFDVVCIDEAGQALEPEAVGAIAPMLSDDGQLVLAGDPNQLGPIVQSRAAAAHGLDKSLLERVFNCHAYRRDAAAFPAGAAGYDGRLIAMLSHNYRSHSDIIHTSNEAFYNGELVAKGDPTRTHNLVDWPGLPAPGVPLLVHCIEGEHMQEETSPSWFNPDEAMQVRDYVTQLLALPDVSASDIGVVTPYHKQVLKIRQCLRAGDGTAAAVKVGSTEQFQGGERRVIIISTVRSETGWVESDTLYGLGFVANPKRFNVAVTRAQALLIVVGNPSVLQQDPHWLALMRFAHGKGAVIGDWEPPDADDARGAGQTTAAGGAGAAEGCTPVGAATAAAGHASIGWDAHTIGQAAPHKHMLAQSDARIERDRDMLAALFTKLAVVDVDARDVDHGAGGGGAGSGDAARPSADK